MLFFGGAYALLLILCTFAQNIIQVYVYIFFIGLLFVPRSACIFTYIFEITPDKYHQDATFFIYLGDGLTFVISGIFIMITKNSFLYLITLGFLTILCVSYLYFTFPESPKFLYSKKRFDEL